MIDGGCQIGAESGPTVTPDGSPGWTSWSGPTVDGGTEAGLFGFGVMSVGGGRIARVHNAMAGESTRIPEWTLVGPGAHSDARTPAHP
jgi:hypothetical protein